MAAPVTQRSSDMTIAHEILNTSQPFFHFQPLLGSVHSQLIRFSDTFIARLCETLILAYRYSAPSEEYPPAHVIILLMVALNN